MTILAFYGSRLSSLLLPPQMASFTLAMKGIFQVRAAGRRPHAVTAPAFLHRQPLTPDVALPLIVVMALAAGHPMGFMRPVTELHRRFPSTAGDRDPQETARRGLGEIAAMSPQDTQQPQD
jgi:hypothetical protein